MATQIPDRETMLSGHTWIVGQRVRVHSRHGTRGAGTIVGILRSGRGVDFQVFMDPDTEWCEMDRWPSRDGGWIDCILSHGVSGGCLEPLEPPRPVATRAQLTPTGQSYCWSACASDLGLKPGEWPLEIDTEVGNRMPFRRSRPVRTRADELGGVEYVQLLGCTKLTVWND